MSFDRSQEPAGPVLFCHNCEQPVPEGATHCPRCCGEDGQQGATKRRAIIGGMVGLMAGGVLAAISSSIIQPEGDAWRLVFGITAACALTGAILGVWGGNRPGKQ